MAAAYRIVASIGSKCPFSRVFPGTAHGVAVLDGKPCRALVSTERGMSEEQPIHGIGERSRAMDALERAVVVAETGARRSTHFGGEPGRLAERAAPTRAADVRSRLDRVMMGAIPRAGSTRCSRAARSTSLLPEVAGDGRLRRRRVAPQGRVEAHEAGRAPGRAAARGPLGRALPRHRQGEDALASRPTARCTSSVTPRSARACSTSSTAALPLFARRAERCSDGALSRSCTTCARTSTRRAGPTARCAASPARWATHLDDLLCLSRADITTKRPEKKQRGLEQISELADAHSHARRRGREGPAAARAASATRS